MANQALVIWSSFIILTNTIVTNMMNHVRWYVNVSRWKPTKEEWMRLTASIAKEELERIDKFVFKDDAKSSLMGCALIRKFLADVTQTPSSSIVLIRGSHGRPEICPEYKQSKTTSLWPRMIDFNVSHSGDYCVLAGVWSKQEPAPTIRVGVDVTKIVRKNTKPELDRFLDLMSRRPFTKSEWESVERVACDRQKCINFTRLWCLKESYIKAIGLGLTFKLQRIDFKFSNEHKWDISMSELKQSVLNDTTVMLDGQPALDWQFYETALDDEHIIALGYNVVDGHGQEAKFDICHDTFTEISVDSIMKSLTPMRQANCDEWIHFETRSIKPPH